MKDGKNVNFKVRIFAVEEPVQCSFGFGDMDCMAS